MQPVTFLEALRFAESRKVVPADTFYSLDLNTRQLATTVSFLSSLEQMQSVIDSVNKAIALGTTFDEFKKDVAENGIKLNSNYLDNVFRTNIQTAYSHGRWEQQQRNKESRPYLMYSAINDSRVRPSHLALNGIIRHIDDPFWLTHYPPWSFRCRCSAIAITEAQAKKLGITSDEDLPQIAAELGWSTSPMTFGDLSGLLDEKVGKSSLDIAALLKQKQVVQAEWTASKKLASLLAPMTDSSRELFKTIADTVLPLDPEIRPSAIKVFVDYVQGNDAQLTSYINRPSVSLAEDVIKRWLVDDMAKLQSAASNALDTVVGSVSVAYASTLQIGSTVTLNSPLLIAGGNDIVVHIQGAKGLGIDLEKLNAGQGVLFEIGLSFEVVSVDHVDGRIVYTLKALVN